MGKTYDAAIPGSRLPYTDEEARRRESEKREEEEARSAKKREEREARKEERRDVMPIERLQGGPDSVD